LDDEVAYSPASLEELASTLLTQAVNPGKIILACARSGSPATQHAANNVASTPIERGALRSRPLDGVHCNRVEQRNDISSPGPH
jgi:hypothetical protein